MLEAVFKGIHHCRVDDPLVKPIPSLYHSFGKEESQVEPAPVLHNLGTVTSRVSRWVESEEVAEWCPVVDYNLAILRGCTYIMHNLKKLLKIICSVIGAGWRTAPSINLFVQFGELHL